MSERFLSISQNDLNRMIAGEREKHLADRTDLERAMERMAWDGCSSYAPLSPDYAEEFYKNVKSAAQSLTNLD